MTTFSQHTANMKTKLPAKNNVLKSLSGTVYHQLSLPIWTPSLSEESWKCLQRAQKSALCIANGSHLMTDVDHLHNETKIMPVKEHCEQFLLSTQRLNHLNRTKLNAPNPDCQMQKTLRSVYGKEIKGMSQPDIPDDVYKMKVKEIHT